MITTDPIANLMEMHINSMAYKMLMQIKNSDKGVKNNENRNQIVNEISLLKDKLNLQSLKK